jgi:hypothetical protein
MPTSLWTPTPDLDGTVAEFDSEFERLKALATDQTPDHRTTVHGCLGALYRMRGHRQSTYGSDTAYFAALKTDANNSTVPEGVITARGKLEHLVVNAPMPQAEVLYPSENLFPGNHTYPGRNLQWRKESDPLVSNAGFNPQEFDRYRAVAGKIVLETLQAARDFYSGL